jgi:hypothetical protein
MILEKDHKGKRILNPLVSKIRLRVIYQCENFQRVVPNYCVRLASAHSIFRIPSVREKNAWAKLNKDQ